MNSDDLSVSDSKDLDFEYGELYSQVKNHENLKIYIESNKNGNINKSGSDIDRGIDIVNDDLGSIADVFSSSTDSPPLIDYLSINGIDDLYNTNRVLTDLQVQISSRKSFYLLELIACLGFYFCLYVHIIVTTYLRHIETKKNNENTTTYTVYKIIQFVLMAVWMTLFITPNTYKSINLTLDILMVNAVVFNYSIFKTFKYMAIQLFSMIAMAALAIGLLYDMHSQVDPLEVITLLFPSYYIFKFSSSAIVASVILHAVVASGLTGIINSITSLTVIQKSMEKVVFLFILNIIFGVLADPIGTELPIFIFHAVCVMINGRYHELNMQILNDIVITVAGVIVFYPLIAIYIKYNARIKILRYIEYS